MGLIVPMTNLRFPITITVCFIIIVRPDLLVGGAVWALGIA